jgi:hypothetical protein
VVFDRLSEPTLALGLYPCGTAQPCDPMATAVLARFPQRMPGPHCAVALARLVMHGLDAGQQTRVLEGTRTRFAAQPFIVAAARHPQRGAETYHAVLVRQAADKGVLHDRSRAKYAAAFFGMSRSSVTRSRSRFSRLTSALSSPAGPPAYRGTHRRPSREADCATHRASRALSRVRVRSPSPAACRLPAGEPPQA